MLIKQKQLNLLGLATRANKLISGEETVINAIKQKKTSFVIISTECSQMTKKKIIDKCTFYQIAYTEKFTVVEISQAIGKKRMIIAFVDDGFANSFKKLQ